MQWTLGSQLLLLSVVGTFGWMSSAPSDDAEAVRRFFSYGPSPGRVDSAAYDYWRRGLGAGGDASNEDTFGGAASPVAHFYNELEKRVPGNPYNFGLGKRSRTYGFGLGKRLEDAWKNSATSSFSPAYKQERRSKMYSFGLGKRGGDDFDVEEEEPQRKKSKQFSFGLGKRDPWNRPLEATS